MARFSNEFLDELKSRIRISDIIRTHTNLKSKGGDEYLGLCPFHKEKTPSFTVTDSKGFYHCFGCGAHGDIFKFTMEQEGLRYPEAIEKLALKAGMELPKEKTYKPGASSGPIQKTADLYEVMEKANQFFKDQLHNNQNQTAQHYVKSRDLSKKLVDHFNIGYAPNTNKALSNQLSKQGITQQQLLDTGLIIKRDDGSTYDRFRDRIMFPIWDYQNRIVAFGGRILGDGKPKYLNSPETPIFKKRRVLYMPTDGRKAAYKAGEIIVTEGYMDAIALYKAGHPYVAAPLGTSLTDEHLRELWKMAPEPTLCLDGDQAGQRAMARAIDLALPNLQPGYSLKFVILPKGMDPDDVIKQHGNQAIKQHLNQAIPLSTAVWNLEYSATSLTTPEQWAGLEKRLYERAKTIKHSSVQHHYTQYMKSQCFKFNNTRNRKAFKKNSLPIISQELHNNLSTAPQSSSPYAHILLALVTNHPHILEDTEKEEEFIHLETEQPHFDIIRQGILDYIHTENPPYNTKNLTKHLEKQGLKDYINPILVHPAVKMAECVNINASENDAQNGWQHTLLHIRLESLESDHKAAVENMTQNTTEAAFNRVTELQKQVTELKEMLETHQQD